MKLTSAQSVALNHLRKAYLGPEQGDAEVIFNRPSLQYSVGMLFPAGGGLPGTGTTVPGPTDAEEFVEADVEEGDVEEDGATAPLAEDWRPSSAAISFVTDSQAVICDFRTATYSPITDEGPLRWQRQGHEILNLDLARSSTTRTAIVGEVSIEIGSRWRNYGDAYLVTVHVRLRSPSTGNDRDDIPLMLFQVGLEVRPEIGGRILEYDVSSAIDADPESRELRLRYRDRKVFAIGHGMAAGWQTGPSQECSSVFLDPVPAFVVPAIAQTNFGTSSPASPSLNLAFLEKIDTDTSPVVESLRAFVDEFEVWAHEQERNAAELGDAAGAIVLRTGRAVERMRNGVARLGDPDQKSLRSAFALGMAAMRLQMQQAARSQGHKESDPTWRPFQLGFILVALASTVDDSDAERDLVDLIWFPTGGGKTEAYLGLAAVLIFLRRLTAGASGAGTAVITRYTLRLLTSQQFQRAASLICAMERLRETDVRTRGMARFSIGLWVGNEATPGTRADARHSLERLYKAQNPRDANEFQITECPWCLTELVPAQKDDSHKTYGARQVGNEVVFRCIDSECPFFERELPIAVVDEVLYDDPPTILLATVDKFARLQFNERAGRLLGVGTAFQQPALIIQDELHLLSGPLGTTVAVFDAVIKLLLSRAGSSPKIIASTATIRASGEQIQGLYGRKVALYPPAGLDGDSTFFARPVDNGEGRLYVGLMPQSVSQATALIGAASPMLEIPNVVSGTDLVRGRLDPYWTLVMYHNSLRELGRSGALVLDDINGRLETRAERLSTNLRRVRADSVLELTSRRGPEELPNDLRQLRASVDVTDSAVDVVLSSNMLSVGIDVQRLALMLMVGQPKTTAEYIQATSRVGRGAVSGIVVTLFRSNRARDRSHFETFRSYHDALYRSVEPTSVTPWSLSSRARTLAGALVALVRQSFPSLAEDTAAGVFDLNDSTFRAQLEPLIGRFLSLVASAEPDEASETTDHVWLLLREWDREARRAREGGETLRYERRPKVEEALVKRFGQKGQGWLVGDSMRSVEPNVAVEVQEPFQEVQRAEHPS
ncbi:helicase-related protein [Cryobacterium sp. TMB1-7]|uniref:helicase-related protein n=1 Tax=Cryobacterium sp. TMB1-7 TaxID=2555866 RepID=UPI00106B30EB|nr:helicase-related protein [Cryobacterium sp. TMB1-7]TFC60828.1 helicase [Cryobacterium sp. TMB1-7]